MLSSHHKTAPKRYNLKLPEELYSELKRISDNHNTSVIDILRRFIKMGLIIEATPDASFFIRKNGTEKEVIVL